MNAEERELVRSRWYSNYRKKIKKAKTDKELDCIIDEIYDEGFSMGNEVETDRPISDGGSIDWGDLD